MSHAPLRLFEWAITCLDTCFIRSGHSFTFCQWAGGPNLYTFCWGAGGEILETNRKWSFIYIRIVSVKRRTKSRLEIVGTFHLTGNYSIVIFMRTQSKIHCTFICKLRKLIIIWSRGVKQIRGQFNFTKTIFVEFISWITKIDMSSQFCTL